MTDTTFTDDEGAVRFSGKIRMGGTAGQVATVQANGTLAPAAAPAPPLFAGSSYSGTAHTIGAGGTAPLFWESLDAGPAVLDLTNPQRPAVIADGTYAVTVVIACFTLMTATGALNAHLQLGAVAVTSGTTLANANFQAPASSLTLTFALTAGAVIIAVADNNDSQGNDFALTSGVIQRIA